MRRQLLIYDFATAPFLNFLMYEENLIFFFYQCIRLTCKLGRAKYLMTPVCPSPDIQSRVRRHCRLEIDQSLIVLEHKGTDV
jgi:hypothetical protein